MSTEIKDRLLLMAKTCRSLLQYMETLGDVSNLDDRNENAICDCINRLGDSIKITALGFDADLRKDWSALRVVTAHHYHKLDLAKIWTDLLKETAALLVVIEEKLDPLLNSI